MINDSNAVLVTLWFWDTTGGGDAQKGRQFYMTIYEQLAAATCGLQMIEWYHIYYNASCFMYSIAYEIISIGPGYICK